MNLLARKLEGFVRLDDGDRKYLDEIVRPVRRVLAHTDIIKEGDAPSDVRLILQGFACRNKVTPDGDRQIMAYLLPGDFCDVHVAILKQMDHSITTLSDCDVVEIPIASIEGMTTRPNLARALWWATLVDEATLREWLVNLGTRDARQKVAHLFCELLVRLRVVGLANGREYKLPITQQDLADTVGLSNVHVNRVLQGMRADGLIELESKVLTILDFDALVTISHFNPNYLHLSERIRP
ncbi:MAG: Crp/Fnr family transcriptional regulator [Bradyrhizobium sp.]